MRAPLHEQDQITPYTPDAWPFWRDIAVGFCVYSVLGHWLEIVYCTVMDHFFGIVDPNSLVWDDPMYPFLVYGIGSALCTVALVPLKETLILRRKPLAGAFVRFFLITVLICLVMELGMGLLLNQPVDGVYPLWDNSQLPGNILHQAWIVNDIGLGAVATLYVWALYPFTEKWLARVPRRVLDVVSVAVIVAFVVLCVVKFS